MPLDTLLDLPPVPGFLIALGADRPPIECERIEEKLWEHAELARLREEASLDRAELAEKAEWLAKFCDQPVPPDTDSDWLARAADEAREKERATAELLLPVIEALKGLRERNGRSAPEVQQWVQDGIDILEGWLTFYRGVSGMLARMINELRATGAEVLPARPVEGDVDYTELSREHLARYPKIRAALGE